MQDTMHYMAVCYSRDVTHESGGDCASAADREVLK